MGIKKMLIYKELSVVSIIMESGARIPTCLPRSGTTSMCMNLYAFKRNVWSEKYEGLGKCSPLTLYSVDRHVYVPNQSV